MCSCSAQLEDVHTAFEAQFETHPPTEHRMLVLAAFKTDIHILKTSAQDHEGCPAITPDTVEAYSYQCLFFRVAERVLGDARKVDQAFSIAPGGPQHHVAAASALQDMEQMLLSWKDILVSR